MCEGKRRNFQKGRFSLTNIDSCTSLGIDHLGSWCFLLFSVDKLGSWCFLSVGVDKLGSWWSLSVGVDKPGILCFLSVGADKFECTLYLYEETKCGFYIKNILVLHIYVLFFIPMDAFTCFWI